MLFTTLGLAPYLTDLLIKKSFLKPTQIQNEAIPVILEGKDVLGIAPTGSGKTAAFVLPILQDLEKRKLPKSRFIDVLVLVPTRELAVQVDKVFHSFARELPFKIKSMAAYGGVSINPQMMAMSQVTILVATPGRLLELSESNAVHFDNVSTLVLDEADKMLNLGFKEEMSRIFALLPEKRQNLLFSATLSPGLQEIEQVLLKDPVTIKVEEVQETIELIQQVGYFVEPEKKGPLLRYLILQNDWQQVLVFVSSKHQADHVADKLTKHGIRARAIHGKKTQGVRDEALNDFKAGRLRVLVSTDLLSRGIDIAFLPHVVNYELPRSPKDFVHRIGRTGRAENRGDAVTFVSEEDKHHFKVIQKKMKRSVDMVDSKSIDFN